MKWLLAIKNFVIGSPQITTDIFDKDSGLLAKAGGFLNDLHYSDVEKAKDHFKIGQAVTEHVKATLGESTIKSKTRRSLAILWIKVQLAMLLMVAIILPFKQELAKDYFNLATCNVMLWGTGSVITFFFGGYVWGTYIKKKQK
ncbi:MAG: hypothetical protein ACTSP3_12740 [Candidatus Heimdallarchaeaceae archaeon]